VIGSLRGVLIERSADGEALIEVGGLGYRVVVTARTLGALGPLQSTVFVYVHHVVREDAESLYGFATRDERSCFEALLTAHGVGPALAQAILSVHSPDELRAAVATGDLDALCLIPGVGKKTAARLVIELKDRLGAGGDVIDLVVGDSSTQRPLAEVREALVALGYSAEEIRAAVRDLPASTDTAFMLREALHVIGH
jgi:Holliday junction DNA helicase RuvA